MGNSDALADAYRRIDRYSTRIRAACIVICLATTATAALDAIARPRVYWYEAVALLLIIAGLAWMQVLAQAVIRNLRAVIDLKADAEQLR